MPTAVAALPLPAQSLPAQSGDTAAVDDGSQISLMGADFAALLLGQLAADPTLKTPSAEVSVADLVPTDTATTPQDPALLLASIGITLPPTQLPLQNQPRLLSSDTALPKEVGGELKLAAPADVAIDRGTAPALENVKLTQTSDGTQTTVPNAQLQAAAPAKLAGFEQKLAEALPGVAEVQTMPQQAASVAQMASSATTSIRQATEQVRLDTPMKDQAWPAEFGQKVVWLATQDKQSAQLTLNPPQLGPIEISLNVKNDQATAVFASASAEVREAIESALPRLREMLAGVGVELGQTNVSAESFQQARDDHQGSRNNAGTGNARSEENGLRQMRGESMIGTSIKRGNSLVDTFA